MVDNPQAAELNEEAGPSWSSTKTRKGPFLRAENGSARNESRAGSHPDVGATASIAKIRDQGRIDRVYTMSEIAAIVEGWESTKAGETTNKVKSLFPGAQIETVKPKPADLERAYHALACSGLRE